jgi:hypothetical protein
VSVFLDSVPYWDRRWRVIVSTESSIGTGTATALDVTQLDCSWRIRKSLKPNEPNHCQLTIHNLPAQARQQLEALNTYDPKKTAKGSDKRFRARAAGQTTTGLGGSKKALKAGKIRVEIMAGYANTGMTLLFRGDLRRALSKRMEDGSWETEIEGEDGGFSVLTSRVTASYPPGTTLRTVVSDCADAMGVGTGNILQVQGQLNQTFPNGTTLNGSAPDELRRILRRAGVRYSIQDGNLQFLNVGEGLRMSAVLLNAESGLIGSPERDSEGFLQVKCLVNPDLVVGGYIQLDSVDMKGSFRIERTDIECSTFGTEWYINAHCKSA